MVRLSLADEAKYSHAYLKLYTVGIFLFVISIFLTTISVLKAPDRIVAWESNDTFAQYFLNNMEVFRNGSYVYDFNNPLTIIDAGIIDTWYAKILEGKHRYDYGGTFNNFCWNRDSIPAYEWMPSLFRSTQLNVIVQVPIRMALLLSIPHRVFLTLVALKLSLLTSPMAASEIFAPLLVANEVLHNIAIFMFYALHIWQDQKYTFFIQITVTTALLTFVLKMFTASLLRTSKASLIARGIFGILTISFATTILDNANAYKDATVCDQMGFSKSLVRSPYAAMEKHPKDVIEFPDSTCNVKLSFLEKDLRLLDDEKTDSTDTSQVPRGSNTKFTAALGIVASTGFLLYSLRIFLNAIGHASPLFCGIASLIISLLAYEWQCLYGNSLSRIPRATLNYTDLLNKNKDYIPFYTMGWLMGEKYKPFVLGGNPDEPDDRTPNEPEAVSPERQVPTDPKFLR